MNTSKCNIDFAADSILKKNSLSCLLISVVSILDFWKFQVLYPAENQPLNVVGSKCCIFFIFLHFFFLLYYLVQYRRTSIILLQFFSSNFCEQPLTRRVHFFAFQSCETLSFTVSSWFFVEGQNRILGVSCSAVFGLESFSFSLSPNFV